MEPNDVASLPVVARWSPNSSNAIPLAVFPNESQETRAGLQRGPTTPSPPHLPLLRPVAQLPGPPPRAASQALCRELEGQPVPLAWRTRRSSDGEATGDGLGEHAGQPPGLGASLVSSARTSAPRCPSPRHSATSHPPLPVASCFSKRRDRVGCCGEAREAIAGASKGRHSKLSPPPRRLIEKTSTLKTTRRAKVRRKRSFERSKLCLINKHCTISSQTGFTDENLKVCPRYLLHEIRTAVGRCASRGPPRLQRGAV